MNYCSSIVVDFGSTNSGCARVESDKTKQNSYSTPNFIQGNQTYAKDCTWFYVRPDFWKELRDNYSQVRDADFRIRSRALPYTEEPNIVWGRQHIRALADTIEKENWVGFKYFKMNLYHARDLEAEGRETPVKDVVRLFLRILKIECLDFEKGRRKREVAKEEIQWGITIPAIWGNRERQIMTDVATDVFGSNVRVLSEPEGPILSGLIHASGDGSFSLKKGRVSLVTDIGGGTTDITLLQEVSNDASCEYPFKVIASTDGIGVGGNNIDDAYWTYILRLLSKGKMSDDGRSYDSMSDDELKETLLFPFVKKLSAFIDMEDGWLNFKHGHALFIQFPPAYLKWLNNEGHKQVGDVLANIMIGIEEIDMDQLKEHVLLPTFRIIAGKIREFLQQNVDKMPQDASMCLVIKAGGLSLSSELCNLVDRQVNDLGLKFTSASLGADPVSVSGSIMDGALIILLNRKIINRKAPFNIYYDVAMSLSSLRSHYKELGVEITMGQLEEQLEKDINNGAGTSEKAMPVGIMGEYLKDHHMPFYATSKEQAKITFGFYGKEGGIVVLPHNNPECRLLCKKTFETHGYEAFSLLIDFNEFPNNNNFHYLITSDSNGEIIDEGNIPVRFDD